MLKDLTTAKFVKLSSDERNKVYKRHLVKDGYVQIEEGDDEDFFNPTIADGVLLRQECMIGSDDTGKQIAAEAREVYYSQNTFTVRSHWLCEFVTDTLADGKPMRIESLVRKIMVRVDLQHIDGDDPTSDIDEAMLDADGKLLSPTERRKAKKELSNKSTPAVRDLRRLLAFESAEWIGIEIHGKGALDGSDLKTQQKLKEISKIVKELIAQFGNRFTIMKVQKRPGNSHTTAHDLKPYWNTPTAQAKDKLQRSRASFEELMQIQIEEWTREVSKVVGGRGWNWESLL
jgi:hypothetical protein